MVDSLSTLGAAASISQLLQFAVGLIRTTREYSKSLDGILIENKELEAATKKFQSLVGNLENSVKCLNEGATDFQALLEIIQDCRIAGMQPMNFVKRWTNCKFTALRSDGRALN